MKNSIKLTISEDTACIASKTSYIEDGFDKNGIYYFGKKPNLPVNWKDYKKNDNKKFKLKESDIMKLTLKESYADENGMFLQMDDAMDGLIGNADDDAIDEVLTYFRTVSGKLGRRDRYSDITCYFSNDTWLDPLDNKDKFKSLTPIYKNRKYDAYIGDYNGNKFIVDHFNDRADFTIYALDESIIEDMIEDLAKDYE